MGKDATTVEELLSHATWLKSLARRLAGDEAAADDLVQETWSATLKRSPDDRKSVRPWLATVMRNSARMKRRTDSRRAAREAATDVQTNEVLTPEALLARAQTQKLLAEMVLRLEEPYRSTVLLHFFEGMSLADIARNQNIAASTARWRLKTALDQLRAWLDDESGGRKKWSVAFLAAPSGVIVAEKTKIAVPILVLLILVAGGGIYWKWFHSGEGEELAESSGAAGDPTSSDPSRLGAAPNSKGTPTPRWLLQAGVEPKRVAGRVLFNGAPVSGATVELASLASESGLTSAPQVTTNDDGEFDFGVRAAQEWSVRAIAPKRTPAVVSVDLRNPSRQPTSDQLILNLGPCDSALVGTIVDASGGPIAGARLARIVNRRSSSVPGGATTVSSDDGSYELCVKPSHPFWMDITVARAGYGAIVWTGRVVGRFEVDFELVPEATISGRVVRDDDESPIAEAHVFIRRGNRGIEANAWRGTFTDASGRFRIDGIAPGQHSVVTRAAGMVPASRETIVDLKPGETRGDVEIRMTAGSTLRGVVLEDGKPAAGARIVAKSPSGTASPGSAVSQADGTFTLTEVPRGPVRFTAFPFELMSPDQFAVQRSEHDGLVLHVQSRGRIIGDVHRANRPIAGARIDILGPNTGELAPVNTDADGRFEISGLAPGAWTLFASNQKEGAFGKAPETVEVKQGATEEVTIELAYGASIAGFVVDQDGAPVAGVPVEFFHTARDDQGTSITSTDGRFKATTMSGEGQYRVRVRTAPNRADVLPPEDKPFPPITLEGPNSEVSGVVLAVRRDRHTIRGTVVDSVGAPVADVRVAARLTDGDSVPVFRSWVREATTTSDQNGHFEISELAAGAYALQARAPSGIETIVTGVDSDDATVRLVLPASGGIEGTLIGFDGTVAVSARNNDSLSMKTASANDSAFRLDGLQPGSYVISASSASGVASARVTVEAGKTAQATLTSKGLGKVVGRVVELRSGQPIEGMTCRALSRIGNERPTWNAVDSVRTNSDGRFEIDRAPAGDIVVSCVGLWHLYSTGMRLSTLERSQTLELDVPVVAWQGDVARSLSSFGADFDRNSLLPRLVHVNPRGPAAAAGLKQGDIVTKVDNTSVTNLSPHGVRVLITNRSPGTEVVLAVRRQGKDDVTAVLTLGEPRP